MAHVVLCLGAGVVLWAAGSVQGAGDANGPTRKLLPVFPGAQGFGVYTPAGRGGRVLRVTSLNAKGPGSLRAAVEAKGSRIIIFEIAGVIDLGVHQLAVREPFLTLAGQTAPSPGITIIGSGVFVLTHDVLVRHLRVRPGDAGGKGHAPDGLCIGPGAYNVVVDHCSFTWAVDENASVSGKASPPHDVTISNCIIAEGLQSATHPKGAHSKGSLIHNNTRNVAVLRNLYAHNFRRNPYAKSGSTTVIANDLIYNPGQLAVHFSGYSGPLQSAVVGNVLVAGPSTPGGLGLISAMGRRIAVYASDNLARDTQGRPRSVFTKGGKGEVRRWSGRVQSLKKPPLWHKTIELLPARKVFEFVLANAGARPAVRDKTDQRIVQSVKSGTGKIIDSQNEVGGYPMAKPVRRKLELPADPHAKADGAGYTNIERWLQRQAERIETKRKP